jgi:hypothetical protein
MESIKHRLGQRKEGFQCIWDLLTKNKVSCIVETGTCRTADNWEGDGQSTRIWDMYLQQYPGICYSVDIDANACATARELVSDSCRIVCADSIKWLADFPTKNAIDFLYLDSHDIAWENPHPSSLHHLKELTACFAELPKKCIIAIDDNTPLSGKGKYVREFLEGLGWTCVFDGYQIVLVNLPYQ